MKQILTSSILAVAIMLLVAGCENDPNSSNGAPEIRPMAAGGGTTPKPAITFTMGVSSKGKLYHAVGVTDSDGTNLYSIYKASSVNTFIGDPSWSPGGTTIAFELWNATQGEVINPTIYLRDLSITGGKVVGSNTRSIFGTSNINHQIGGLCWSSLASTNKIAFITRNYLSSANVENKIQVISPSGGTPTVLYQSDTNVHHTFTNLTYSPDDSKIAFIDHVGGSYNGVNPDTLRIINASTGALLESIGLGAPRAQTYLEWSRSGANVIALTINYTSSQYREGVLYYVTPTSGSTPWTNNVSGDFPTWSPNNSSVMTCFNITAQPTNVNNLKKTVTGTSNSSTITTGAATAIYYPEWKR